MFIGGACKDESRREDAFSGGFRNDESCGEDVFSGGAFKYESLRDLFFRRCLQGATCDEQRWFQNYVMREG